MIELRRWVYYRGEFCLTQTFGFAISITIELLWFNGLQHEFLVSVHCRTSTGRLLPVCQDAIWHTRLVTQ
jgi:hypothetical protein